MARRRLKFEMGKLYYLKLEQSTQAPAYKNEVLVQHCKPPKRFSQRKTAQLMGIKVERLWFNVLAAQTSIGNKTTHKAFLGRHEFDWVTEKKTLKISDLPLYVGMKHIHPKFTKLLGGHK